MTGILAEKPGFYTDVLGLGECWLQKHSTDRSSLEGTGPAPLPEDIFCLLDSRLKALLLSTERLLSRLVPTGGQQAVVDKAERAETAQ
jgi:hypothetical protein